MRAEDIILNAIKKGEFIIDEDGQIWRHRKGKLVRAEHRTPQGYLQIRKMVNNKRYHTGAHRVVWEYFNGRIPDGYIINHKNGQKDDNRPWNLELPTVTQTGQKNPATKLTDKQVDEIRLAYSGGGYTQRQLAKKYGVSYQYISKIVRGERRRRPGSYEHLRQRNIVNDPVTGRFVGKKAAGRLLDALEHNEMPEVE